MSPLKGHKYKEVPAIALCAQEVQLYILRQANRRPKH